MSEISGKARPVRVFINYRKKDSWREARLIKYALEQDKDIGSVFMDVGNISPGETWPDEIKQALEGSSHVLAVMGQTWLTEKDEHERRRIDDPEDWVRLEIISALAARKSSSLSDLGGRRRIPPVPTTEIRWSL
jgi:hypothetical protein